MTSLSVAARRFAARPSPKGSGCGGLGAAPCWRRPRRNAELSGAERRFARSGRGGGATCGRPELCVRVKLDDFAQRRCAPLSLPRARPSASRLPYCPVP